MLSVRGNAHGWLILDKPAGMTSTKAGSIVKRAFKTKCLGHLGTLDPFATGVLPLALGEATKTIPYLNANIKEYEFEITFGEERDSHDIDGQVVSTTEIIPTAQEIKAALPKFLGSITQIPPEYSAIKIEGKRACDLVRQGKEVKIFPRTIDIYEFELITMVSRAVARLRVLCGAGTYVRSLGRDLAKSLNSLGYINQLRRTRVGKFSLKNSQNIDTVLYKASCNEQRTLLLSIRDVLDDIPAFSVFDDNLGKIRLGQSIEYLNSYGELTENQTVLLLCEDEESGQATKEFALAQINQGRIYPKRLLFV